MTNIESYILHYIIIFIIEKGQAKLRAGNTAKV